MSMTILTPLDGSPLAEEALPYASALARAEQARLVLMRSTRVNGFPGLDVTEDQVQAEREAEGYLASIVERLAEHGVAAEIAIPYGSPAQEILEEISIRHADLLVMATHGRPGLERLIHGSVTESVLVRSPIPVLLVRAGQSERSLSRLEAQPRLVVPLDGSQFSEAALPVAATLADALGAELVLLRAVAVPPPPTVTSADLGLPIVGPGPLVGPLPDAPTVEQIPLDRWEEGFTREAREYLNDLADRIAREHPGCLVRVQVSSSEPAEAIAVAAEEHEAALVVMATHGHTGILRPHFGSVAHAVLEHGDTPLLLVRPENRQAAPLDLRLSVVDQ